MGYVMAILFMVVAFTRLAQGRDASEIYFLVSAVWWLGGELAALNEKFDQKLKINEEVNNLYLNYLNGEEEDGRDE